MTLDSTTVANVSVLAALSPSWGLVVLIIFIGFGYLVSLILKNTDITKALSNSLDSHTKMATIIDEIRADQIKSNEERREQGKSIERLDSRINQIDFDMISLAREVNRIKCSKGE